MEALSQTQIMHAKIYFKQMLYFICFQGDVSIWAPLLFCNKYQNYHQGLNHHLNLWQTQKVIFFLSKESTGSVQYWKDATYL